MSERLHDVSDERRWRMAFAFCALAAAIPLLVTYRLPMADLPQHSMQVTVWKYFDDPCYRFRDSYEINWFTPYLLGTSVMRVVASVFSVAASLKIVTWLSIVALPLVMRRLTDFVGVDRWLSLLGFPISFGFSFYWGFINFTLTAPLAILLLLVVCCGVEDGRRAAEKILILSFVIATAHALVYLFAVLISAPPLLLRLRGRRSGGWLQLASLLAPVPLLAFWTIRTTSEHARAGAPWRWELYPARLRQILEFQLSPGNDIDAFWFSIVICAIAVMLGVRLTRSLWRWTPFAAATAGFLFMPFGAFGQTFLYPRLAAFAAVTAILVLDPAPPRIRPNAGRLMVMVAVVTWMAILAGRFSVFHRDAVGFDRVVDIIPANQRVLLLNVMQSDDVPGMPFLHFSGYYVERKGGVVGWSFASNFPPVLRYKAGVQPGVPPIVTHQPQYFDWAKHSHFDYFVVRAPGEMAALVFRESAPNTRFLGRAGNWWLYENRTLPRRPECTPIEADAGQTAALQLRW